MSEVEKMNCYCMRLNDDEAAAMLRLLGEQTGQMYKDAGLTDGQASLMSGVFQNLDASMTDDDGD